MERRNFLKVIPIAAISPQVIKDGAVSFNLPEKGHFVIVANVDKVDLTELAKMPGILPEGATGGYIVGVYGDPEEALKFYKLDA